MSKVTTQIMALAEELGYEGDPVRTVAAALDALRSVLDEEAEDTKSATIASAVAAVAPAIADAASSEDAQL